MFGRSSIGLSKPIFGPDGGVITRVYQEQGKVVVNHTQDVTVILADNHAARSEKQKRAGTFRRIGQIPMGVIYQWAQESGKTPIQLMRMSNKEFLAFCKKKLRDADYRALRTVEGNI